LLKFYGVKIPEEQNKNKKLPFPLGKMAAKG